MHALLEGLQGIHGFKGITQHQAYGMPPLVHGESLQGLQGEVFQQGIAGKRFLPQ